MQENDQKKSTPATSMESFTQKFNVSMKDVIEKFNMVFHRVEESMGLAITPVLGYTGAGKSTLINFLVGHSIERYEAAPGIIKARVVRIKEGHRVAAIGQGVESKTLYPEAFLSDNVRLCDMAGYGENRGKLSGACTMLGNRLTLLGAPFLQGIVIVLSYDQLKEPRSGAFIQSVSAIASMVEDVKKLAQSSLLLVIPAQEGVQLLTFATVKYLFSQAMVFFQSQIEELEKLEKTELSKEQRAMLHTYEQACLLMMNIASDKVIFPNVFDKRDRVMVLKKIEALEPIAKEDLTLSKYSEEDAVLKEIITDTANKGTAYFKVIAEDKEVILRATRELDQNKQQLEHEEQEYKRIEASKDTKELAAQYGQLVATAKSDWSSEQSLLASAVARKSAYTADKRGCESERNQLDSSTLETYWRDSSTIKAKENWAIYGDIEYRGIPFDDYVMSQHGGRFIYSIEDHDNARGGRKDYKHYDFNKAGGHFFIRWFGFFSTDGAYSVQIQVERRKIPANKSRILVLNNEIDRINTSIGQTVTEITKRELAVAACEAVYNARISEKDAALQDGLSADAKNKILAAHQQNINRYKAEMDRLTASLQMLQSRIESSNVQLHAMKEALFMAKKVILTFGFHEKTAGSEADPNAKDFIERLPINFFGAADAEGSPKVVIHVAEDKDSNPVLTKQSVVQPSSHLEQIPEAEFEVDVGPDVNAQAEEKADADAADASQPQVLKNYLESDECDGYEFNLCRTGRRSMLIRFSSLDSTPDNLDDIRKKLVSMFKKFQEDLTTLGIGKKNIIMKTDFKNYTLTITSEDANSFDECLKHLRYSGKFISSQAVINSVLFKASAEPVVGNAENAPEVECRCQ